MEREAEAKIKTAILEAEKHAKTARAALEKARRAGFDVKDLERNVAELEARVARAKAVYVEGK